MDYQSWRIGYDAVVMITVVANFAYTWIANRHKANRAAIDRVDEHLTEVVRRVDRLESRADSAPTHEDLSVLHERVTDLAGAVRELTGVMGAVRRSIDRVETYLLENKK